jgi:hypothetical protein
MSSWRAFPERSWSEVQGSLSGFGPGTEPYGMAYVTDAQGGPILNGRVSARIRLGRADRASGVGLVCRADGLRSFAAFYVTSEPEAPGMFSVRLAAFKFGSIAASAALRVPVALAENEVRLTLQFFSGELTGELLSGPTSTTIHHVVPEIPFAGRAGLVRFYGAPVMAKDVHVEEIRKQPVLPEATEDSAARAYKYDVFLSYTHGDKNLIAPVLERFRQAGIAYWFDEEQITFGDRIVRKIEDGLQQSRYVVVALSKQFKEAEWRQAEYGPIFYREFSGDTSRRVIPLSLDGSTAIEATGAMLLSEKMRADFTNDQNFKAFLEFLKKSDPA